MGDYTFESFYEGGGDFLDPSYNTTGFQLSGARLGFPGMPQTANQLGQAMEVIKSGVKAFEVTTLGTQGEDIVPIQHYDEMRALMKLSGVKPSLHGPLIDPAGFGDRGQWSGEVGRVDNERRMYDAVQKAHKLDPQGNIPIVFHAGNSGGREYRMQKNADGEKEKFLNKSLAVNRDTGQVVPIEYEKKFRPGYPGTLDSGGVEFDVMSQVRSINETEWDNKMTEMATFVKQADEIMAPSINAGRLGGLPFVETYRNAKITEDNKIINSETGEPLPWGDDQQVAYNQLKRADIFLDNVDLNFKTAFHKAYKFGDENQKKALKKLSSEYEKNIKSLDPNSLILPIEKQHVLRDSVDRLKSITSENRVKKNGEVINLGGPAPQLYQEVEEFAMDKSAETFANLAVKAYDEFGDSAPTLAIENLPEHMGFSDPEQHRDLIIKTREKFAEKLEKDEGFSKDKAMDLAKERIGATWDVGHINTLKKRGFTDKEIVEATKTISEDPTMVKHLHLTDNFGFSDSHLPPGMGNVPLKKHLETLEKTGRLDEMNKIVEAGAFISQFQKSPLPQTLSAFSSPIYGMKMGPTWNQVGAGMGGYFGGMGTINPDSHHQLYGAGFTTLPTDFGGQMPGTQSRFGGTPMA